VDEYDKPMNHSYMIGEIRYKQVSGCITKVLECIKNEKSILYASLTGIATFPNLLSGLNNLVEQGILE